jgi:hypothetical protein
VEITLWKSQADGTEFENRRRLVYIEIDFALHESAPALRVYTLLNFDMARIKRVRDFEAGKEVRKIDPSEIWKDIVKIEVL